MSTFETLLMQELAARHRRCRIAALWLVSAADALERGDSGGHGYWDRAVNLAREAGMSEAEIPPKPEAGG